MIRLALCALLACAPLAQAKAPSVAYADIGPIYTLDLIGPKIALLQRTDVVRFRLNSPGGSVEAGMNFVDAMRAAQRRGTKIECVVDGMAASMAAYILQACDVRLMTAQSQIMFHTVSVDEVEGGNQWHFERLAQELAAWNKRLAIFIAGRLKLSIEEYEARVYDRDYWVGFEEALKIGAVDGVL